MFVLITAGYGFWVPSVREKICHTGACQNLWNGVERERRSSYSVHIIQHRTLLA